MLTREERAAAEAVCDEFLDQVRRHHEAVERVINQKFGLGLPEVTVTDWDRVEGYITEALHWLDLNSAKNAHDALKRALRVAQKAQGQ